MQGTSKSIKSVAKQAKLRLKTKFWENYKEEVEFGKEMAKEEGLAPSRVTQYYQSKIAQNILGITESEHNFYLKVKHMLDNEGMPVNALDKLMDKDYFYSLSYNQRESYLFKLSKQYLTALDKYAKEKPFEKITSRHIEIENIS